MAGHISLQRRKAYGRVCVGTCCPWGRPGASASFTFRHLRRRLPRNQQKSKPRDVDPRATVLWPIAKSRARFSREAWPRRESIATLFLSSPPPVFLSFSTCSLPAVPGVHALVYPQGAAFPEMKASDKSVANGSERGLAEANRRGWSISHISGRCCTKIWINSLQSLVELNLILYLVTFFSSVITCHWS